MQVSEIGVRDAARPTVGQMMARDVFTYTSMANPVVVAMTMLVVPTMLGVEGGGDALVDPTLAYGVVLLCVGTSIALIYWRHALISSLLTSGVETPGEVTSVTRSGDSVTVEYTYRCQGETVRSTRKVGGFVPKRRVNEVVGLKAALLVNPAKPERFLALDTLR